MESYHPQTDVYQITEVSINDLKIINEIENQLSLNLTTLNFFKRVSLNNHFNFLKLQVNFNIIGFILFSFNKKDCDIISIGVCKNFQKQGYGKKLIEYLKNKICLDIFVEVSKNNKNALIFYKKLKFIEIGLRKKYYKKNNTDAILLKL